MDGNPECDVATSLIVIVHDQRVVGHAINAMLAEDGFDVLATIHDPAQLDDIFDGDGVDLCVVGSFISNDDLRRKCDRVRERFPGTKIALVDSGFSAEALEAAKSYGLEAYLSLEMEPSLFLNGL